MKKKKIIRVIARLNVGGPAIHVILLTAGLDPERYETILVSGREAPDEGNMLHLAEERGVDPTFIENLGRELNPIRDLNTLWKLYRLFKREQPDIVHTHTAKAGFVGRFAAKLAGVPIIIHTFHGHVLNGYFGSLKTWFFCSVEKVLAHWTETIIAVSNQCREDLLNYGIGDPDKIKTIHLGLELDRFTEDYSHECATLRKEWGVPEGAFLAGIIARMVPIKRHCDLFRAIPFVLKSYPETYFVVVGDGELRDKLTELAQELKIEHRCIFAGFRQDQETVYQALNLVVLTSANEGLPVAIIEGLSSGRTVVSTNVGGVSELVDDGVSGYLAEPGNIESIAEALIKAISDPERTHTMGQQAQRLTIERYSIKRLIHDLEELYDQ